MRRGSKIEEYPSISDYRETVEEFLGRDKTQEILRRQKHFLVHTNETSKVADITRRILFGYASTEELRGAALSDQSDIKSTAFTIRSEASKEELVEDLSEAKRTEGIFNEKKNLKVQDFKEKEDNIEVDLEYTKKQIGRRELVGETDKETTVVIEESEDEEDVRTVKQDYEKIDEANAVSAFFEGWNTDRRNEGRDEIDKFDLTLKRLGFEERMRFFDALFSSNPGSWVLEDIHQIGIKQAEQLDPIFEDIEDEEDLEEELDDNLQGITDAVLTGEALRQNGIVQKCEDNGYYFNSTQLYYDNLDVGRKVEVLVEFKEGYRQSFDISIEQGYLKKDGEVNRTTFDEDVQNDIREQFRDVVIQLYYDFLRDSGATTVQEAIGDDQSELTDITGVGPSKADSLREAGYESLDDLHDADPDDLEDVEGIGQELAIRLAGSDSGSSND